MDVQESKRLISDVFEFNDEVRGFDTRDLVDPLEQLDMYREFLGEVEFEQVKANYMRTIETMDLVFQTEL